MDLPWLRNVTRVRCPQRLPVVLTRTVQEQLGHTDVSTTMICAHVLNRGGRRARSPLERL